jgi:hypothetical protein
MQTADKIQAALLCVQICVGAVQAITTYFFIKIVGITRRQEKDANDQILLAQRQMELMTTQYNESLRPLIAVTLQQAGSNFYEIRLCNEGTGPALRVQCEPRMELRGTVIGSKSEVMAYLPKQVKEATSQLDKFLASRAIRYPQASTQSTANPKTEGRAFRRTLTQRKPDPQVGSASASDSAT